MSVQIRIGGWVSIVPTKMYKSWIKKGWIKDDKQIKGKHTDKINKQVNEWYDKVFEYVRVWLIKNDYIKLKSGSFEGGFCVEDNPTAEVVLSWGAPLSAPGNKVMQIKEKFGEIVVYFCETTEKEDKEIEKFAKHVEKKFDCCTRFW